ncbi:MAG: IS110 family transposase [Bryobacterales bacterium]|nr:IS110 family transposase [Bryobacterales bacterium]
MVHIIAGIDVHKRMLMVAVGVMDMHTENGEITEQVAFENRRFGTTAAEWRHLAAWLSRFGVQEVVMESTAQYWKPVWLTLEGSFRLQLAQAWSNRAPRGKKTDYKDAQRLVRRHFAGELTLSFVPDAEQRQMRTITRRRTQLTRERVRLRNQLEALLEEGRIKLSSVISDLLGASGRRILEALADGVDNPESLAALGDERLKCTREQLVEALSGNPTAIHRKLVRQYLDQLSLLDKQREELSQMSADSLRDYSEAVRRLAQIPGIRVLAAQQIVAEAGPRAEAFPCELSVIPSRSNL